MLAAVILQMRFPNFLMDVKIDHYISLTMDSVAVMNDLVGGVEVTVLDDFLG